MCIKQTTNLLGQSQITEQIVLKDIKAISTESHSRRGRKGRTYTENSLLVTTTHEKYTVSTNSGKLETYYNSLLSFLKKKNSANFRIDDSHIWTIVAGVGIGIFLVIFGLVILRAPFIKSEPTERIKNPLSQTMANIDKDKQIFVALSALILLTTISLSKDLRDSLNVLKETKITNKIRKYIDLEVLLFLFFETDLKAYISKQSDEGRGLIRKYCLDDAISNLLSIEPSQTVKVRDLEVLIDFRLCEYTKSFQKVLSEPKSTVNPPTVFLHSLQILVKEGKPKINSKVYLGNPFEDVVDLIVFFEKIKEHDMYQYYIGIVKKLFATTGTITQLTPTEILSIFSDTPQLESSV